MTQFKIGDNLILSKQDDNENWDLSGADTIDTRDGTLGGGEILQIETDPNYESPYFNQGAIKNFENYGAVKALIAVLLVILAVMTIMKILSIRSLFKDKAIQNELDNINAIRARDKQILLANKGLGKVTKLTKKAGLKVSSDSKDYISYNLKRAGVRVPGGARAMTPDEFNGCIKIGEVVMMTLSLVIMLFMNLLIGLVLFVLSIILLESLPMLLVRNKVHMRDAEIQDNFLNLYLMIHYELLTGGSTPIARTMRSYLKMAPPGEMIRFVDNCCTIFDTYGEYQGTQYVSKDYREIPEVCKLMRLIRQQQDGGDIKQELLGFRESLIDENAYKIERRSEKLIKKAKASFNILMIVLVQAVLSAMSLYLPDLSVLNL